MGIVQDEGDVAELLALWFDALGWDVTTASSGPEGLAATIAVDPDILILDDILLGFNGREVLRRLRVTGSTTPVIITTALDDFDKPYHPGAVAAAGAQARLIKPYSLVALEERVRALCTPEKNGAAEA